jgi:hypothetical protein
MRPTTADSRVSLIAFQANSAIVTTSKTNGTLPA